MTNHAQFDIWDRYDYDEDGDFDEPDGYIDHFQAIHAGEGEEGGGGAQGSNAIWSHRWYVQLTGIYEGGPILPDGTQVPFGGVQIGESRFWVGDYTIEPENGGVGVFAHEFAHDPHGQNYDYGITGNSGGWTQLTADLGVLPEGEWYIGFEYWTDVAEVNLGFMVDAIEVTGYEFDGGESDAGWIFDGFMLIDGYISSDHFNAYVAEFRQHVSYDDGLRTGPYNFGFLNDPDLGYTWVEHFPYQEGLLVHYWDTSQRNNNTSQHPGAGLILPIDAHPEALMRADGVAERTRVQSYDSTFGLEDTDAITLHWFGVPVTHPSLPAVSVFDDTNSYWNPDTPLAGVQNPHTDTQIWINSISAHGSFMQIQVN